MVLIYFWFMVLVVCQVPDNERDALMNLYISTLGQSWTNKEGWTIGDPCLSKWFGVGCFCNNNNNCTITSLELYSLQLSGTIPESIGSLYNLTGLDLDTNQLSGTIPESIGNLYYLSVLDLDSNKLSGTIPESIGNLYYLTILSLYVNLLSGTIPESIGNISTLLTLDLDTNQLSGTIPESIGNLHSLTTLVLNTNQLSGTIPESIQNLSSLTILSLFENLLSGTIPESIQNLSSLTILDLDSNQLSGTIPESIGNLQFLIGLYLNNNKLSGTIPESIGNLNSLTVLNLNTNKLSGTIPVSIGNFHSLLALSLYVNLLSGTIPESIGNLTNLLYLDLDSNQLSGTIPESIGKLIDLTYLDLDSNQLSGTIPESIGKLTSLTYLDLHSNQLSGTIPESIGKLIDLTYLDLHLNQLSGAIPQSIFNHITKLQTLLMSDNMFSCFGLDWNTTDSPYSNLFQLSRCSFEKNNFDCYIGGPCNWIELKSTWNITNCPFPCSSLQPIPTPTNKQIDTGSIVGNTGSIVGIVCGGVVAILLICVAVVVFLLWKKNNSPIQLPPEITWSFDEVKFGGEKKDNFKIKLLPEDSKGHKTVKDMFYNQLGGKNTIISEIYAVYPKDLLDAFVIYERNLHYRLTTNPILYQNQQWKKSDPDGLKQWMMNRFDAFANSFSWNIERNCKIIPQLHGTNFSTAMAICNSGFTTLSLLDAGWYGRGIYFSSCAVYLAPYFATKSNPTIIISYIIPGNPYPVTENPTGDNSLVGSALKGGAQSHYVVTSISGLPLDEPQVVCYDELVISQEAQVLPAFVLVIDKSNLNELLKFYNRATAKAKKESGVTVSGFSI